MDSRINRFSSFVPLMMSTLALGAAAGWVAPASATENRAGDEVIVERIRYDDLNVATESGRKALMSRLQTAAVRVCDESSARDVLRQHVQRACVRDALSRAVAQVEWVPGSIGG